MNKIYDNGALMIGRAKDILEYADLEKIDNEEILEIIKELKDLIKIDKDIIVYIDYENPMSYTINYWTSKNIIGG
jgi:hypothetical protein